MYVHVQCTCIYTFFSTRFLRFPFLLPHLRPTLTHTLSLDGNLHFPVVSLHQFHERLSGFPLHHNDRDGRVAIVHSHIARVEIVGLLRIYQNDGPGRGNTRELFEKRREERETILLREFVETDVWVHDLVGGEARPVDVWA